MRFHVLGICHTISTNKSHLSCAFTQKVVKFCTMMSPLNEEDKEKKKNMTMDEIIRHKTIHHMIHYGHEKSDLGDSIDEHVTVINDDILTKTYGNYDWKKEFYKHGAGDLAHTTFTFNTIAEIIKRKQSGDFILCFWGVGHKQIADVFANECLIVEPGIGYPLESSFAKFKIFESYAVMHYNYGLSKVVHPPWYDCVVPNYFDPKDFDFVKEKGNYFLYLGRIITTKGLEIIIHLAKKMGFKLLIAGQGSLEKDIGQKESELPENVHYIGYADMEKRRKLMANAKALFLLTYYVEPFGGVTMEAMMSGTPVITTDWGVFTETVLHGITGYRCRTLDQYEWAINNINNIDPQACRDWAINNYSIAKVRTMYEEYFDMVLKVKFGKGFYEENFERDELDWLYKEYPDTLARPNSKLIATAQDIQDAKVIKETVKELLVEDIKEAVIESVKEEIKEEIKEPVKEDVKTSPQEPISKKNKGKKRN
jgi:glycosyltransferase involved in cell wall biosynthesis